MFLRNFAFSIEFLSIPLGNGGLGGAPFLSSGKDIDLLGSGGPKHNFFSTQVKMSVSID